MGAARTEVQAVMSIDQRAAYLQIPKSTLYKLVQEGKVLGRKPSRKWRSHRSAVNAWLAEGTNPRATERAR